MHKRTRARGAALQALYQVDIGADRGAWESEGKQGNKVSVAQAKKIIDEVCEGLNLKADVKGEACEIFFGVLEHLAEIDTAITGHSEHWSLERMALVDRNVLRVAAYELLFRADIPFKVVIDEGVELVKRFGSDDSGAFINGILDKLAKEALSKKEASCR